MLRDAGATPHEIQKQWALTVKPKPRWVPTFLWERLVWCVLKKPPGLEGRMEIAGGKFHRVPAP